MLLAGDFIPKAFKVKLPECFRRELVLANLEGPVCVDGLPVSNKVGVCLHSAPFDIPGRWAFALANNHMMDFCEEGLCQTRTFLKGKGYSFAGAGDTEEEARKPMLLEENGVRIAIFSCCERQFGMATETTAGCATMGVWLYDAIRTVKARGTADRVIVSCHAASEFSPWVSPSLHDFYHSLIDVGADVIHGHHAHVPQGFEEYKGCPIFYGLGNFVVDPVMWRGGNPNQLWSIVAEVRFCSDKVEWSVCPYVVSSQSDAIVVSTVDESSGVDLENYISNANTQFSSRNDLSACWQEAACRLYYRIYGRNLRPPPVVAVRLPVRDRCRLAYFAFGELWRTLIGRERPTAKSMFYGRVFYNVFNCQSHVDMIRTAMGIYTGASPDLRTETTARMADYMGL